MNDINSTTIREHISWEPRWIVPIGNGCNIGIIIDDHCYVVLVPSYCADGSIEWSPAKWIPSEAARFIGVLSLLRTIEKEDKHYRQQFQGEEI